MLWAMKNPAASSGTALDPVFARLPTKFQQAVALQRRGQWSKAQFIVEKIVKAQPKHVDALILLGVVAAQRKDLRRAVQLFDRALAVDPINPAAYCNQGSALHELRQLDAEKRPLLSACKRRQPCDTAQQYPG